MTRDRFVILADESADWKIAGLRQLDRLALAVNEFTGTLDPESKTDIIIFWQPGIPSEKRWVPNEPRLSRCRCLSGSASLSNPIDLREHVVSTRLLVKRRGLAEFMSTQSALRIDAATSDEDELWGKWSESFRVSCGDANRFAKDRLWRCLVDQRGIGKCERWLLRASGKSNDGMVARFLHRPISRAISRLLLKTGITPNEWSIWTIIVPLIGCAFIWRGNYAGFVVGAALYQFHNVLDGCDGEIARAKYLESERGRQIDAIGDLGATVLLALSMGIGLSRYEVNSTAPPLFYLVEGFVAALLLSLQWLISRLHHTSFGHLSGRALSGGKTKAASRVADGVSEKIVAGIRWLLVEVTKRDVSHFFFVLFALAGLAAWILHFLFAYAFIGFGLTVVALSGPSSHARLAEKSSD